MKYLVALFGIFTVSCAGKFPPPKYHENFILIGCDSEERTDQVVSCFYIGPSKTLGELCGQNITLAPGADKWELDTFACGLKLIATEPLRKNEAPKGDEAL